LKAAVSKIVVGATPPGVRIPPSPPVTFLYQVNTLLGQLHKADAFGHFAVPFLFLTLCITRGD